jgi:hypothetical protein
MSTPLITRGPPVGAFNLYSDTPGFFGATETRLAERFAREATVAVDIAACLSVAAQAVTPGRHTQGTRKRSSLPQPA